MRSLGGELLVQERLLLLVRPLNRFQLVFADGGIEAIEKLDVVVSLGAECDGLAQNRLALSLCA
jgi:hypothetical protein